MPKKTKATVKRRVNGDSQGTGRKAKTKAKKSLNEGAYTASRKTKKRKKMTFEKARKQYFGLNK